MSEDYSGSVLYKKLGLKEDMRLGLDNPPPEFVGLTLLPVPAGVTFATRIAGNMDMVMGFYEQRREMERRLPVMVRRIPPEGAIWICWPKKASRVPTDITADAVREVAGPLGLVDTSACAIDQMWSGIKLVSAEEKPAE